MLCLKNTIFGASADPPDVKLRARELDSAATTQPFNASTRSSLIESNRDSKSSHSPHSSVSHWTRLEKLVGNQQMFMHLLVRNKVITNFSLLINFSSSSSLTRSSSAFTKEADDNIRNVINTNKLLIFRILFWYRNDRCHLTSNRQSSRPGGSYHQSHLLSIYITTYQEEHKKDGTRREMLRILKLMRNEVWPN